jgi:L-lactate dehydrogenase complex protein LldG
VVVRADTLVHNLHEAYERIQIPSPGFSMWLSGPSKTADIEQALVIGAHGARSCTVLLTP